jgi:UDP-glucose 4-epimerase
MNALVTGGAGFIGSNLVECIVDKYNVTVLDNFQTGSISNLAQVRKDVKVVKGSCSDCLAYNLSPDVIFHLGIPSSAPMYRDNPLLVGEAINGAVAVMELARRSRARKVIIASSSALYSGVPTPQAEYAAVQVTDYYCEARLAIERVAELYRRMYDIDYSALRFFSLYGPHERSKGRCASQIARSLWSMQMGRSPVIYGDGTQTRDFLSVLDACEAMIMAAWKGTGVFNVGSGKRYSFNAAVDILNIRLKTKLKPEHRENPERNYMMHTQADTSKIGALGFRPRYSLEEGIDLMVRHG